MKRSHLTVRNMVYCAISASLLAVCAWISIPIGTIGFTMHTFGVFFTLGLLGGKRGTVAILVYLLLGAVGLPVFSGFQGGVGVLFGITGGYIWGFLAAALLYWLITALGGGKLPAMALGMTACYACGTAWFLQVCGGEIWTVLTICVLPYLLPDTIKIGLALYLSRRLERIAT